MVQALVLLSDLLSTRRIKVPLEAGTKDEILRELVDVLAADGCIADRMEALRVVRDREAILSTGIGQGVAIPHGKTEGIRDLCIAAGVSARPVEFEALDGQPVNLFFLLVGPESAAGPHIKALSRISRLVRQPELRERLLEATDSDTFLNALREAEIG